MGSRRVEAAAPDGGGAPRSASRAPSFLVVAVGASAGGLEAFTVLLRNIPAGTPLALLLIQHLARTVESHLAHLLRATTGLTVTTAQDRQRLEPGHVYVIPPNTRMTVLDGIISVKPLGPGQESGVAVDVLFRSIAQQYQERAVGVVLSGGGQDGASGLRDIKAAGGLTFAQSPEEASMDAMPRAAIATGTVDAVLPLEQLAGELVRLSRHPHFQGAPGQEERAEEPLADAHLRRVFQLLRRGSGVDFTQYKPPTISRRIQRRIALNRLSTLADYATFLQQNPKEVEALQEDLLIHVTSFFREPDSFEALKTIVFPRLLASHTLDRPIRIWVPGCSTGEEPYSVAMSLLDFMGDQAERIPLQVFGTDVSERSVERARSGVYPETIAGDVPPDKLRRFFAKFDGGYRIGKAVRERCVFARQDITRDPPFSKLDLVVCRNLLIYLSQPMQRRLIGVFHYALKPNGYLILGRSETIGTQTDLFAIADKRFKVFLKKRATTRPELDFRSPASSAPSLPAREPSRPSVGDEREWDLHGEVNRFLIDRYAPPGVIVDADLRIVRSRGRTSPFLELPAGDATLDLFKMARPGLLAALRGALGEARSRGSAARRENVRFRSEGESRSVNVEVTPVGAADGRHYLVVFEPQNPSSSRPGAAPASEKGPRGKQRDRLVEELEDELTATREHLQAIIHDLAAANEELQSANEEILSSNEELQSTNEELDTAKEELQSTNEELSTLNDELEGRNEEMSLINSDLLNLLASVQIPIVIVSNDLRIRRFTPAAERTLNLIVSDVGRPIGHIKPNIVCPDLEHLILEVVETVTPREREVEDREGRLYALRIRPYKNIENKIDGAVLTLFDVTSLRDKDAEAKLARATGEAIMTSVREPILLLRKDLTVERANRAFYQAFAADAAETEGRSVFELGQKEWDIPELRRLLEETLPERKNFEGFAMQHRFARVGTLRMLMDGRRIEAGRGEGVILLIIRIEERAA